MARSTTAQRETAVLRYLAQHGPATSAEIHAGVGAAHASARYHLRHLAATGLVTRTGGHYPQYYLTPQGAHQLRALGVAVTEQAATPPELPPTPSALRARQPRPRQIVLDIWQRLVPDRYRVRYVRQRGMSAGTTGDAIYDVPAPLLPAFLAAVEARLGTTPTVEEFYAPGAASLLARRRAGQNIPAHLIGTTTRYVYHTTAGVLKVARILRDLGIDAAPGEDYDV